MRPMYAVAILFLLAGCSSVPAETRAIPAERLLGYQQPVSGGGRLEVHRDYGYLGGGCCVAFLIDRQVAARIGVGEEASFQVPAGEHVVGIGIDTQDDTLCGKGLLNREREPGSPRTATRASASSARPAAGSTSAPNDPGRQVGRVRPVEVQSDSIRSLPRCSQPGAEPGPGGCACSVPMSARPASPRRARPGSPPRAPG